MMRASAQVAPPIMSHRLSLSRSIRNSAAVLRTLAAAACVALGTAAPAAAHGFGQRYDLPLPLSLYLFGAAAAVALSFVVFGLFVRHAPATRRGSHVDLLATAPGRLIAWPGVVLLLRLVALGAIHRHGARRVHRRSESIPQHRANAGVDHLLGRPCLCFGLRWRPVAADQSVADVVRRGGVALSASRRHRTVATAAVSGRRSASGRRACCCSPLRGSSLSTQAPPCRLTSPGFAAAYSILTLIGMFVFGRDIWLQHGEVFTIVFGTFARFAPTQAKVSRKAAVVASAIRGRAARRRARLDVHDGIRVAPALDRAL